MFNENDNPQNPNEELIVEKPCDSQAEDSEDMSEQMQDLYTTPIAEVCLTLGYNEEYSKYIPADDKASFDKVLLPLAREFLNNNTAGVSTDAKICVHKTDDDLCGYIFVFPPLHGGNDFNFNDLNNALEKAQVKFGVKEKTLLLIAESKHYCKVFLIAKAQKPIEGKAGFITQLVSINEQSNFSQDVHGRVDFKRLNLENNIIKDTAICTVTEPILGIDGTSVSGKKLLPTPLPPLVIPTGKGTYLADDGITVLASISGRLSLVSGKYTVENVFTLKGNVDNSTGNIDFVGDLVIEGDIKAGFELRAGGSIYVKGIAEDCHLSAGGNIEIKKGINADNHGTLQAAGNINCSYIENCHVTCGGTVTADTIVSCQIFSDDSVIAKGEKGIILNSKIMALNSVIANVIGSESNREVQIALGKSYTLTSKLDILKTNIKEAYVIIDNLKKNIEFLENAPDLPQQKLEILDTLREQFTLYTTQVEENSAKIAELDKQIRDFSRCKLSAEVIHPICKVSIADHLYKVTQPLYKTEFRILDNEIRVFLNQ